MDNIYFSTRDELIKVNFSDVMYIKADGNYSVICMKSGRKLSLLSSLNEIKKLLDEALPNSFFVVGRSHIVNIQYVSQINSVRKTIVVADDNTKESMTLHVSKHSVTQLMEVLKTDIGKDIDIFVPKNGNLKASAIND